ncbi:helix-turn-helix domain-containing protein [Ekhidna sp.]
MILIEDHPREALVSTYIDRYQLFIIDESAFLKTIPNGKMECYLNMEGSFQRFEENTNLFQPSGQSGFLPAGNKVTLIKIPNRLVCLNIKLNLKILSLSLFENLLTQWQARTINELIAESDQQLIINSVDINKPSFDSKLIDSVLANSLSNATSNLEILKLLDFIENQLNSEFKVAKLADHMNMSSKTLERFTKTKFRLSPKELWNVVRFESTTSHLKKSDANKLIEALSFGFYDQSHFSKECKRITGYSPKSFFSKLKLETNDIIFEE